VLPRCTSSLLFTADGRHTCDCPGHKRRRACKHVAALVALAAAGRLPGFAVG